MFRWFKRREDVFQKLIEEQASVTYEALRLLVKYLETLDADVAEQLSMKEKEADEVRRILIDELNRTFVTPFDREDIFALSRSIDDVVVPATGRFAGVYVQATSAYAPHPNAAKLWMEFLYSDEGQILWMEGYCHPIREADLRARGVIPQELLDKLPDVSGAVFPTLDQLNAAKELITTKWDTTVGADVK